MAGLHRRKRKADGKRTLAAATLLGGQYERKHCKFLRIDI
jgi:hypothetical protein